MEEHTSIIVLSHNALDVTKRFLSDLYAYTENFTLIMIDNGSSDDTPEYLSKFAENHDNMVLVLNDANEGVIGGRNQGYEIFKTLNKESKYLCILDNDQFVQKGWLEQHAAVMEESNAHLVGVEAWQMSTTFRPMHKCTRPSEPWVYLGCGGMLMKTEVPAKIGMFDEQFNPCYFEDPDFCFRARQSDFRLAWNYKARIIHLPHQTLGKNPKKMQLFHKSHKKFLDKWRGNKWRMLLQDSVDALK